MVFGLATRLISLFVVGLAIAVGVIGRVKPTLFFHIPRYGFIPWFLTGHPLPPYFDKSCFYQENWSGRKGDVVISSGVKAGTFWLQNIVFLLRSNGWDDFEKLEDIMSTCVLLKHPEDTLEQRLLEDVVKRDFAKEKGIPGYQFYGHYFPGNTRLTVGLEPSLNPDVKYIALVRNGREVVKSFYYFINSVRPEFRAMWGGFPSPFTNSGEAVDFLIDTDPDLYFGHLLAWWERKHLPNVKLVHYRNLRQDSATTIREIAEFLELPLSDELLDTILHKSSLEYMSDSSRADKFTLWVGYPGNLHTHVGSQQHVRPGGGQLINAEKDDFLDHESKEQWEAEVQKYFGHDPALLEFASNGVLRSKKESY